MPPISRSDLLEIADDLAHDQGGAEPEPAPEPAPRAEPIQPADLPASGAQLDDDLQAHVAPHHVGRMRRQGSDVWVSPKDRPAPARRVNTFAADELRAQVVIPFPKPPKPVVAAFERANAACDRLQDAIESLTSLPVEERQENDAATKQISEAVRTGEPVPVVTRTDWQSEEVVRQTKHDMAFQEARSAVGDFKRALIDNMEPAFAAIVADIEPSRERARKAFAEFAEAFETWRTAVDAGHKLAVDTGRFSPSWWSVAPENRQIRRTTNLDQIRALVNSDDLVLSGQYLVDPQPTEVPGQTVRALEAQANGSNWQSAVLGKLKATVHDGETRAALNTKSLPGLGG